jgi:hypothetical protein
MTQILLVRTPTDNRNLNGIRHAAHLLCLATKLANGKQSFSFFSSFFFQLLKKKQSCKAG